MRAGGAFGPFEHVIHVPKPDDIGQPDWANSIIESASETACPADMDKAGFSSGARGFGVSDEGRSFGSTVTTARATW